MAMTKSGTAYDLAAPRELRNRRRGLCCDDPRTASAPRLALRAFPPHGAGAFAPAHSQRERRDGRWRFALTHTARRSLAAHQDRASRTCPTTGKERSAVPIVHPSALAKRQPRAVRSDATCTAGWPDGWPEPSVGTFLYAFAHLGPSSHEWTPRACGAGLSRSIHARPPRWRLGDAPKRMPCAFLCFSPANPQLAFSRLGEPSAMVAARICPDASGMRYRPRHRCRHGSGAREKKALHPPAPYDARPRRNDAAMTASPLKGSRLAHLLSTTYATSNRPPLLSGRGARDPWRWRWRGPDGTNLVNFRPFFAPFAWKSAL